MDNIEIKDGKITAVDWVAVFPSLRLVKSGREALEWRRMVVAFLWAAGMLLGGAVAFQLGLEVLPAPDGPAQEGSAAKAWLLVWGACWGVVGTLLFAGVISRQAAIKGVASLARASEAGQPFLAARGLALVGGLFFLMSPLIVLGGACAAIYAWTEWHGLQVLLTVVGLALFVVILPSLLFLLPAIAVDGNDAFDAPGRAVSYVLARPWALALHLLALAFFAAIFVGLPCAVVYGGLGITFGIPVPKWLYAMLFLPIFAYAFSFLITGITRIYLLIRESADGVPETEIWMPEGELKNAPEAGA